MAHKVCIIVLVPGLAHLLSLSLGQVRHGVCVVLILAKLILPYQLRSWPAKGWREEIRLTLAVTASTV